MSDYCEKCMAMKDHFGMCACPKNPAESELAQARLLEDPTDDFRKEVAEMDVTELRRRVMNQRTYIDAYHKCLDGLGLKYASDGHRRPDDIREVVKMLLGSSNESSYATADQKPPSAPGVTD